MDSLKRARRCADLMYANDRASQGLGIEIEINTAGSSVARMRVRQDMLNGFDICHGGLVFALGDTALAFACNAYNNITVVGTGSMEFLRPAKEGDVLTATGKEDYRGRRNGYYTVNIQNQDGDLVALFRARTVAGNKPLFDAAETDT